MPSEPNNTPPILQEVMRDITELAEKEKVELTSEIREYVREHVRMTQDQYRTHEDVSDKDIVFIENAKSWLLMPKQLKERYSTIEDMKNETSEANKREISLKQWLSLLNVAEASHQPIKWIDETFDFPGNGKIHVEKSLSLVFERSTSLRSLPDNLTVENNLTLENCPLLTSLPNNLKVGEELGLHMCPSLTSLPDNFSVRSLTINDPSLLKGITTLNAQKVEIENSNATSFPKNFPTIKWLRLFNCPYLESLSDNLNVKSLYIRACPSLKSLPDNLRVDTLTIGSNCDSLKSLPDNLNAGTISIPNPSLLKGISTLNCNLELSILDESFPEDFPAINGTLRISYGEFKSLPDNLRVRESLELWHCCSLRSLPNNLGAPANTKVKTDRYAGYVYRSLPTKPEVPEVPIGVGRSLQILGCPDLKSLPDDLNIQGDLDITSCQSLKSLPRNLHVRGNLYLNGEITRRVKRNAKKLKAKGKIEGEVIELNPRSLTPFVQFFQ